jgi:hypothetical protein
MVTSTGEIDMLLGRTSGAATLAGAIAVGLLTWVPTASSGSPAPAEGESQYLPIQSISYAFGSKSLSGYFVQKSNTCRVVLMISERRDPEEPPAPSAVRVRLVLTPGQIAGLDSVEGRSLNFTCGEGAAKLLVQAGETARLVELQNLAQPSIAQKD